MKLWPAKEEQVMARYDQRGSAGAATRPAGPSGVRAAHSRQSHSAISTITRANGVRVANKLSPDAKAMLKIAQAAQRLAVQGRNRNLERQVHRFVSGMTLVHDLWYGFHICGGKIEGKNGLAKRHLHVTPNAVYVLLRWLKLKPSQFRDERQDWSVLVARSRTLAPLLEKFGHLIKSPKAKKLLARRHAKKV